MNVLKKYIISISPNSVNYADLIINNCINENNNRDSAFEIILNDKEYTNILYNLIVYGRLLSRTNKSYSTHDRLYSLDDDSKHLMSLEIEHYQRISFYLDKIIIFCLFICLTTFLSYILI